MSGYHLDFIINIRNHFTKSCKTKSLAKRIIKKYFPKASIYDGGLGTALQTRRRLSESGLLAKDGKEGKLKIINSAEDPSFEALANKYLKNITM